MLSPHGTGTSAATGRVYHFLTGTGQIAVFEHRRRRSDGKTDSRPPELAAPRSRTCPADASWWCRSAVRAKCINAPTERFARSGNWPSSTPWPKRSPPQLPVFYGEPTCFEPLFAGTPHERAALQYAMPAPDGEPSSSKSARCYGPPNVVAESRFVAVFDLSDPYRPVQLPSIAVGAGNDTREHALTGDGKLLLVTNQPG